MFLHDFDDIQDIEHKLHEILPLLLLPFGQFNLILLHDSNLSHIIEHVDTLSSQPISLSLVSFNNDTFIIWLLDSAQVIFNNNNKHNNIAQNMVTETNTMNFMILQRKQISNSDLGKA